MGVVRSGSGEECEWWYRRMRYCSAINTCIHVWVKILLIYGIVGVLLTMRFLL